MKRIVNAFLDKLNRGKRAYAVVALCAATAIALPAQTFTTLFSFDGTDGLRPFAAALVQATNGDLYGTTSFGGANGYGTIFTITPSGTLTTLYSFCAQSGCSDGELPEAGLVQATNGDFYGTTNGGGANGYGTIFKITPSGTLTTRYSFCTQSGCTDGTYPIGGLVQAANGDLYGTASGGGDAACSFGGLGGCGTIFKITPSGALTTLYTFCTQSGCTDGQRPAAGLVQATNGDFYGTTQGGGAGCLPGSCGTVFKITPGGTLTTLYSFGTDGVSPLAGLVQAPMETSMGQRQLAGPTAAARSSGSPRVAH